MVLAQLVSEQCTQVSRVAEQEQSQSEYFMAVRAELLSILQKGEMKMRTEHNTFSQ